MPGFNSGGHVDLADGTIIRWTEGWTLRDCRVEGFSGAGINTGMAVQEVRVEGVECIGNGNAGIQVGLLSQMVAISGGRYDRNGTNGIDVNGTRCVIEGNDAHGNGWNHFWDAGDVRASDRNGILLYIAPFRGTDRTVRLEAQGNVVRNNRCTNNERAGIMAVGTSAGTGLGAVQRDTIIEGNHSARNFSGVMIEGAGDGEVATAVIRGNELMANGNDLHGGPKGWGFLALGYRYPATRLENNVFGGNWTAPWLYQRDQVTRVGNLVLRKGGRPPAPGVLTAPTRIPGH
jgi:hypothetical protein